MHLEIYYVRNYVQQIFFVIKLRQALKQVRTYCLYCHMFQWIRVTANMADLTAIRFEKPENDPRTFRKFGIDCIGTF